MPQGPPQNDAPAQVVVGMTEAQVRALLGNPTVQTQVPGRGNVFVYTRQITFQNGHVVAVQ
jgi:outer membrane protein assembly factor BamE (lipoprotein component of BamABCDE complex)